MSHWRRPSFWVLFAALLLASPFVFGLFSAVFISEEVFERWAVVILPLQVFVTLATPYVIARRLVSGREHESGGFPVIQREPPDRERSSGRSETQERS